MISIKNPARSRPLSANVKRLMKMARESPQNPDVEKIEREFTARDLAYCDMQGNIILRNEFAQKSYPKMPLRHTALKTREK